MPGLSCVYPKERVASIYRDAERSYSRKPGFWHTQFS